MASSAVQENAPRKHTMDFAPQDYRYLYSRNHSIVRSIRVAIHDTSIPYGEFNPSANHVSLYLLLDNEMAVRVNMRGDHVNDLKLNDDGLKPPGRVEFTTVYSHTPYKWIRIEALKDIVPIESPTNPLRVAQVYDIIRLHDLHMYRFSPGGMGCHYWNFLLLLKLREYGFIDKGAAEAVAQFFHWWWRPDGQAILELRTSFYEYKGDLMNRTDWHDSWPKGMSQSIDEEWHWHFPQDACPYFEHPDQDGEKVEAYMSGRIWVYHDPTTKELESVEGYPIRKPEP